MIFLVANDPISHTFWHYYRPKKFRGVDMRQASRLGKLIPNFYAHNDSYLGRLKEVLDEDTVVIVVSDHGFQASGQIPRPLSGGEFEETYSVEEREAMAFDTVAIGQSGKHHELGLFLAAGGPIRESITVAPSIYDIAPTILALQGMPVPDDMPGRVLTEIIEPDFLKQHPVRRIESYRKYIERKPAEVLQQGTEADEEILEMLRALGYID
jgi:predicted AlkP superfamily phosphohydrolase/phosphomutase